ncbi:Formyl transferase domain protein [Elusimicrobium minutum Pei191]|uniref:Phosphoribosylglycinamide formyltransferase n=1 Tax=Elusimicrobium minutum (strain Pei191) TaxID=445932 RepID=B2KCF6_ELUMP|nr:phosphoribosylglycinamide formyltransferase [Elusimicrobium minutum]ACC98077.1 Formyl transferase domain protein [Elusimicrobium minutum Pei191]
MSGKKIVVFASGGGSNFQALYYASQNKIFNADIVLLVASKEGIGAVEKAKKMGIDVFVENQNTSTASVIKKYKPDLICLAGYLKMIPQEILDICPVINIHPALLPEFGGKGMYGHHVHEAVIKAGAAKSGATVHFVNAEYDDGPIILQENILVEKNMDAKALASAVLKVEHKIYPLAVKKFFEENIT